MNQKIKEYDEVAAVEVKVRHTNKPILMLHQSIGSGTYDGRQFSLIVSLSNKMFCLEYDNRFLLMNTLDLAAVMVKKIVALNSMKDGKVTLG